MRISSASKVSRGGGARGCGGLQWSRREATAAAAVVGLITRMQLERLSSRRVGGDEAIQRLSAAVRLS